MKQFFAVILVMAAVAKAQVVETNTMREVEQAIDEQTLVVFDIDNTLLEASQTLGSDQWFDAHKAVHGFDETIALWIRIQKVTHMQAVEAITPSLVKSLQARGITVMALTARPTDVANATRAALLSAGIDLRVTAPSKKQFVLEGQDEPAKYEQGIVFAGKNSKGDILKRFIAKLNLHPSKIVFTDDKAKHTATVDASLNTLDVIHTEFRYGAADAKVKGYDQGLADIQLKYFEGILSDDAAEALR